MRPELIPASILDRSLATDLLCLSSTIVKHVNAFFHARVDAVSVKSILGQQKLGIAMRHQTIGNPHSNYPNLVLETILFEQLEYSRAEPAGQIRFFDGDDDAFRLRQGKQQLGIERFYKACVDYRRLDFVFREMLGGLQSRMNHGTVSDNGNLAAVAQDFSLADFQQLRWPTDVSADAAAAR